MEIRTEMQEMERELDFYRKRYDEGTGGYYYYNKVTCTTSWEKPKLLRHEMEGVY